MIPDTYSWLLDKPRPRLLSVAMAYVGTAEIQGKKHNPIILAWARGLGGAVASYYQADEIPWCGLFMSHCCRLAGYEPPAGYDALRARGFESWGAGVDIPALGDVLVFTRRGGGHVGIYVGEDETAFHTLGGNQGDRVSIVRIARERLTASRRAPQVTVSAGRVHLAANGALSLDEA